MQQIETHRPSHRSEIAVVGMAGRFPGARNIDEFWKNLRQGVTSITFFSEEELLLTGIDPEAVKDPHYVKAGYALDDIEAFDAAFFGYSPGEAETIDPQQRLLLECAWEALESAGYDAERFDGLIGVYAGMNTNTYLLHNLYTHHRLQEKTGDLQLGVGNITDFATTRISYKLNLRGPSFSVQTACSTSLVAVHIACQNLLNGECDMALAGGVALHIPSRVGYLSQEGGILSPDGYCRAFDADGGGTVFGNGVGVVVLKRLEDALAERDTILAVIKGSAINNDGASKVGFTAPSIPGQAGVIAEALAMADIETETIQYIEAHGTATRLGDPIEIMALSKAFQAYTDKQGFCAIGSVKTNIGHLGAAAGVAGLIKTILSLQHKEIPPSLHFSQPNPAIDFAHSPFYVNTQLKAWETGSTPRRAGVSSFGFGGTNAHVVLEEAPALPASFPHQQDQYHLLLLSARTPSALRIATANLATFLQEHPGTSLGDLAYTLQVGRKTFTYRHFALAQTVSEALQALHNMDSRHASTVQQGEAEHSLIWMFPGQGAQYVGMAQTLYEKESVFHQQVDYCAQLLLPVLKLDIRTLLYPEQAERESACIRLQQTSLTQPALFVIEYALARLLQHWGLRPDAMIGHSLGEYVAATLSGVFSLEQALSLVAMRGQLMQQMAPGSMLAVSCSVEQITPFLNEQVELAAINAPHQCVLAGQAGAIEQLISALEQREIASHRLATSHAFHSALMEPMLESFATYLSQLKLQAPTAPFISNLTGSWITPEQATDALYWVKHLRQPVRFADGINELCRDREAIFLEVGPGRALSILLEQRILEGSANPQTVIPTLPRQQDRESAQVTVLRGLGEIWVAGGEIAWENIHRETERHRLPLPTYPFERQKYWVEALPLDEKRSTKTLSAKKLANLAEWFSVPSWERCPLPSLGAMSHRLGEGTNCLIFCPASPEVRDTLMRRFIQSLEEKQQHVITVLAGEKFARIDERTYVLHPGDGDGYHALVENLAASHLFPKHIFHMWSLLAKDSSGEDATRLENALTSGFYSLLFLAQALERTTQTDHVSIWAVTNNTQEVVGGEVLHPECATVSGPCLVIPQEYPHVSCCHIDIALPLSDGKALAESLLQECLASPPVSYIAYRGKYRWSRTFKSVYLQGAEKAKLPLREKGVYIITGGLGGIGLILAEYLAEHAQARLVLVNRAAFPERAEWATIVSMSEEDSKLRKKIQRLQRIESLGAQLSLVQADVTDLGQMKQVMDMTLERWGSIHGVIHAAGVAGGGVIQLKTREEAEKVLAPKVEGALVLERLLGDVPLDFFVLCSSLSSVLGGVGQVDYAAANAFLDAFACQGSARLAINWDTWQEVGMAVDTEIPLSLQPLRKERLEKGILPSEGVDAFCRILASGFSQVLVSPQHFDELLQGSYRDKSQSPETWLPHPATTHPRPDLSCEYVAPRNEIEQKIAEIWQNLLRIDRIGVCDEFFELGGHSLLATQVLARIRDTFQLNLPLSTLFKASTVEALAQEVSSQKPTISKVPKILPREGNGFVPLSYAQQRLWFLDQLTPGNPVYNIHEAALLRGQLHRQALERSLNELVRRHEALRTTFRQHEGQPVQIIASALHLACPLIDLRRLSEAQRSTELARLATQEAERSFDLAGGPLLRSHLLQLAPEQHALLLTMHHIISDGWSMGIFYRELSLLYSAFAQGQPSPLPELPIQYADYALWQRQWLQGEVLQQQVSFWTQQLADAPSRLELPTDHPRPPLQTSRGASQSLVLSRELSEGLQALSQREGVTLFMTLLAAFQILLMRYSGQEDIVVGTPIANRTRTEVEPLIGFFVNTLVLRTRLSATSTVREVLQRVRDVTVQAYAHQDVPFEKLVEDLAPERHLSHSPLFQVMLVLQNLPRSAPEPSDLMVEPLPVESSTAMFDLTLTMVDAEQGLKGVWEYKTDLFEATTISRMLGHYQTLLQAIVAQPQQRLADLPLLNEAERQQLLEDWNPLQGEEPPESCLHHLFEAQVEQRPDAIALSLDGQQLSYRELNARSNQLAHGLSQMGIRPQQRIALLLTNRSLHVIAILGVLKAGCAFVCLDPYSPQARLQHLFREIDASCCLSETSCIQQHQGFFEQFRDAGAGQVIVMDPSDEQVEPGGLAEGYQSVKAFQTCPTTNPAVSVSPTDSAYIAYTSGSTGTPKGIVQSHRNGCQFVNWFSTQFHLHAPKRVAQWATMTFDAAYVEIFATLCFGATLCMTISATTTDPDAVLTWLRREQITLFQTVPSFLRQVLLQLESEQAQPSPRPLPHLQFLLVAGEVLPVELALACLQRFARQPQLVNLYGPTEATLATYYRVQAVEAQQASIPIGRPIAGRHILILDQAQRLCPPGVIGELYIRSPYLAHGYFRRPEETQAVFVQNPLHDRFADRVYRTGDMARWLADGTLEFVGRRDQQIKIRGMRIEPKEIETVLIRHGSLREYAVRALDDGQGNQRLVAYVVPDQGYISTRSDEVYKQSFAQEERDRKSVTGASLPTLSELQRHVRKYLPEYMVPTDLVVLTALPLTPNGKVNYRALPVPDRHRPEKEENIVAPRNPVEELLVGIWSQVLGIEQVGIYDHFFDLGGHSLLATQVISRVRSIFQVDLPLRSLFEAPTVVALAERVEVACQAERESAEKAARILEKVKQLSDDEVRNMLARKTFYVKT